MTEIEIKAHVTDPVVTEKTIRGFASFVGETIKSDVYWKRLSETAMPGHASRHDAQTDGPTRPVKVRIRDENGAIVVTYKRKELQNDIEINDEREFSIDDRAAFETLITDLEFAPYISKEKNTKTFAWRAPDKTAVTIELSLVAGLGWFVEIEILADNPNDNETSRARSTLRETLAKCGIPESAIESRYYTDMLASLNRTTA